LVLAWVPLSSMHPLTLLHCKVFRRLHILLVACYGVPQIHDTMAAGFLFVHWAVLDLIRYPFYFLNMLQLCPPFLRWLRYSEFIVIYPISFLSEMYLWWVMYPYIYDWPSGQTGLMATVAAIYSWLLIAYLVNRIITFPFNYKKMLSLRGQKGVAHAKDPTKSK